MRIVIGAHAVRSLKRERRTNRIVRAGSAGDPDLPFDASGVPRQVRVIGGLACFADPVQRRAALRALRMMSSAASPGALASLINRVTSAGL
jgi:hypothetical protein